MICIGQIKGGTHDSRSLYIVHASEKKDQLSHKKRQVDCILIVFEEVVVVVFVGYVWSGRSVGVRSKQDCLLR